MQSQMTGLVSPTETDEFLEDILAEWAPPAEITVTSPSGKALKFRQFASGDELQAFKREAAQFLKSARKTPHISWASLVPREDEIVLRAYTIHYLSVEPKISIPYAFKVANTTFLGEQIMSELVLGSSQGMLEQINRVAEHEGKESVETVSEETSSSSAESGDTIPTN